MRTEKDIYQLFQAAIVQNTNKITSFEPNSVIAALGLAVSRVHVETEYRNNRALRSMFTLTARGEALDALAYDRFGLSRLGASGSSVYVVFDGPAGTVIPSGTVIKSTTGLEFATQESITLGTANPEITGKYSIVLADSVKAASNTTGAETNVPANTITEFVSAIDDVTVNNPLPATGGSDSETDAELAERIRNYPGLLNQNTDTFYTAAAQAVNSNVLRVHARRSGSQVFVDVVHRAGINFSAGDLTAIKNGIISNRSIEIDFTVQNLVFTEIDVEVSVRLESGFTLPQVFSNIAEDLVAFIDWKVWPYGELVPRSDLISLINNTVGVDFINTANFLPASNVNVTAASLPRLRGLVVTNLDDAISRTSVAVTQKQAL